MPSQEATALPKLTRTIDDVRASVYGYIEDQQDAFAAKGWLPRRLNLNKGVIRGLLEAYCWGYWQIYALLQRLMRQAIPATSTGDWLNDHAASVNLSRRPATKARGKVRFYRAISSPLSANITIPARRIVRTLPDGTGQVYRYSTLADAVLPAGADYVDVAAEAEDYGAQANASAGQICELVTPVESISGISNDADWLLEEGADEETDAQLRERYALEWAANNGCTKYAYKAWALAVPGVTSVSILDQHPRGQGTVDIVVRGADVLPTEALLDKVREAIAPKVPINDDWLVKGPVPVACTIEGELEYTAGDPVAIVDEACARIRALFAETSPLADVSALQIGQDLTLDLLTHTVMAVPGVKRVSWQSPAQAVINVPADGVARLESLALSSAMAEEI